MSGIGSGEDLDTSNCDAISLILGDLESNMYVLTLPRSFQKILDAYFWVLVAFGGS